jgi:hypothetical protein
MAGYLDGSVNASEKFLPQDKDVDPEAEPKNNPAYDQWLAHDQQVLSYLLGSLSTKVLG